MLSRIIYGSRVSVAMGLVAVAISVGAGAVLGLLAGFYRGPVDLVVMRLVDVMLAFPGILLALVIIAVLGPDLRSAMIAVGISGMPLFIRVVRGSTLAVRELHYVEAAQATGCGDLRVLARHVLPNVLTPVIVLVTLGIPSAIVAGAALSFLGLGDQAAHARLGRDAEPRPGVHGHGVVAVHVPRAGHRDHRRGDQPLRRRPAGRARPAHEALGAAAVFALGAPRAEASPVQRGILRASIDPYSSSMEAKVVRTIRARFSKGVFEPLEPEVTIALHEGEQVLLTVSTPASGEPADLIAATAGAWKGLVDGEALKRHIYADRLVATRPPARL